ncbi:hypothetical protein BABINDRAFT_161621 [Babjeviella inositovora NRRL Y-12698]|uniref:Phospholipid-transporting ATPase n=1 Tax=Babjeviella inositovora NRRL Y-12698 TaxID=984486 RepID=A0A1E3QSQ6_9ASCO|nr:uncharacterized protein BABINDRAFT_161621 [Babjeviella inositovora NRRL Y-12698]ODQ79957.1 hypothetical protein BABINDRAFT_161621 [Babjeviella inositovora NRRL Y-12698]
MSRRSSTHSLTDSFGDLDYSLEAEPSHASLYSHSYSIDLVAIPLTSMDGLPKTSFDDHAPLMNVHAHSPSTRLGLAALFAKIFRKNITLSEIPQHNTPLQHGDEEQASTRSRDVYPGMNTAKYPSNAISNSKYNAASFIPIVLYEQFKFFFNLYFLVVALSQAIPQLRIGYLSSYIVPLAFVLSVTMFKEALDDIRRRRRDSEQNNEMYEMLEGSLVPARSLVVGDVVKLPKGRRVPADMVLLQSSEATGEAFVKTDQLDGETDWKLRVAPAATQGAVAAQLQQVAVVASAPSKEIDAFLGTLTFQGHTLALSVDQTLWANTVLASGTAVGIVVYTGADTRQVMNTTQAGAKTGLLEEEINRLSKILCAVVLVLSVVLVACEGFQKLWYLDIMRFLILFSTIIPVSLRVNLDLGKTVYAYQIERDSNIPDTIVRTSTIPEDLGRIEYLLSDKTGTLTQNDMEMKKLHLGTVSYAGESFDMVDEYVRGGGAPKSRRDMGARVRDLVTALALCHNVTPTVEDGTVTYQAASPDEVAIVTFTERMGLALYRRDRHSMTLIHEATHRPEGFEILQTFPFTSDTKRMGIVVRNERDELWFLQKGADTVMAGIVQKNDWLEEETGNMAREGLRTLVVARKRLTENLYREFADKYYTASLAMAGRDQQMQTVVARYLETDLELLGLTGVEDKLQKDVKLSIELLRNAGAKIWMLTGDKVETAKCVAISAKLISRGQIVHTITRMVRPDSALGALDYLRANPSACLVIDGESLAVYLRYFPTEFFAVVVSLPVVVACRCTPQQKADVALLIRAATNKRVCCIGDGGNDVSMIRSADVGVGIVGKEGKQASLAADFSITQFCHLTQLTLWHGRNSYKRSAKVAQFVIHRGLLISICQAVYSVSSHFEPLALYKGWLMVGYSTVYTMMPVFSMVLDTDVSEGLVTVYPELYKELTEGKSLSYKTFFVWVLVSVYQGAVIQGLAQVFCGFDEKVFTRMVAVSFSALILNELIMVGIEINTWRKAMVISEVVTFALYFFSIPFLTEYFDLEYVQSVSFIWQTLVIIAISLFPVWAAKAIRRKLRPPNYAKVQQD